MSEFKKQAYADNLAVLGNTVELVGEIVMEVAGNDASDSLGGEALNREKINGISLSILNRELTRG